MAFYQLLIDEGKRRKYAYGVLLDRYPLLYERGKFMNCKSTKLMLLGLTLIGIALFIQGEPGIKFHGNEFFLVLLGSSISITGFFYKE